jgi:CRP/FNR family transcriptional regulator
MNRQLKKIGGAASVDSVIRKIPFLSVLSVIRKIPFLSVLSDDEARNIKDILIQRQFTRNQVILHEEDTCKCFYYIFYGKVKAVQYSLDGRERILAIHGNGEYFGEISILDGKTLPATVVAMEDTNVGIIYREQFERHLLSNKRVLKEIIGMLCNQLRESWLMLKEISFADAEHRLRFVLKNFGSHHGAKDPRGIVINLRLTHGDIANLATVSRETATRLLNRLEESGEIEILEGKRILIKSAFFQKTDLL